MITSQFDQRILTTAASLDGDACGDATLLDTGQALPCGNAVHHRAAASSALVVLVSSFSSARCRIDSHVRRDLENLVTEDNSAPPCCVSLADLDAAAVDLQ
jgi:hypothetical protein